MCFEDLFFEVDVRDADDLPDADVIVVCYSSSKGCVERDY